MFQIFGNLDLSEVNLDSQMDIRSQIKCPRSVGKSKFYYLLRDWRESLAMNLSNRQRDNDLHRVVLTFATLALYVWSAINVSDIQVYEFN